VPTTADLNTANIDAVLSTYLGAVRTRWHEANTAGLISLIEQAKAKAAEMNLASARQPIPGFEDSKPEEFQFRLDLNIAEGANRRNALGRALASGSGVIPDTISDKIDAVRQLRRVDDILIRVLAAKQAALATGVPMAEAMALYRIEGNLDVPAGSSSLVGIVPSDSPTPLSRVAHMPPHPSNSDNARMFPHLVWFSRHSGFYGRFTIAFPPSSAAAMFALKEPALVDWFLHICGFDDLQTKVYAKAQDLSRPMRDMFAEWSEANWTAVRVPSTKVAAADRWDSLVNNLEARAVTTGATPAFSVTPKMPVTFVAGVLAEGLVLLRARGSTETFRYLSYNAGRNQAYAIAIRGLIAARKTTGTRYKPLRDAIAADAAFTVALTSLESRVRSERDTGRAVAELLSGRPDFVRWLSADEAVKAPLLGDFLETASTTIWPSWKEHRGNLSRFLQLLDYYRRVFP
jgi:hypothetical protein